MAENIKKGSGKEGGLTGIKKRTRNERHRETRGRFGEGGGGRFVRKGKDKTREK